jgi:hypothetical protein
VTVRRAVSYRMLCVMAVILHYVRCDVRQCTVLP